MILKPISEGRGVASLVAYLTHDQVSADDPRPTTDERVAWTATLGGSPTGDVDLCVRMMQGRVADAPLLKQRAGVSARGRKLRNPYAHFTAAWPPGQTPTRDEQLELADRALSALGLEDHLAILVAHNDTDHAHWHLVVCKVHPDTGKAASLGRSGLRLSKVAEQWEREHGGIVIDNRVRRREARERYAEYVAGRMSDFKDRARRHRKRRPSGALPSSTPLGGAPATCTRYRPPNGRGAPAGDLEPMASARTGRRSTNRNGGRPRRRRSRGPSGSGNVCSGACARRVRRGTGRAPSPSDWSRGREADTASSGAPGRAWRPRSAGPSTASRRVRRSTPGSPPRASSACSAADGGWAMPSIPRWTPSSTPAAPARPLCRWTATANGTSAHDAGSTATSAPSSRSCATTTRRSGGRR